MTPNPCWSNSIAYDAENNAKEAVVGDGYHAPRSNNVIMRPSIHMIQAESEMFPARCSFCTLASGRIIDENSTAIAIRDGYPVSHGHTLLITKRHIGSFFDLTEAERSDILALLNRAKLAVDHEFQPQGYNIGINDGPCAGQTVPHLHVHLIPRYAGDLTDPRGGVRWVLPEKAKYWP